MTIAATRSAVKTDNRLLHEIRLGPVALTLVVAVGGIAGATRVSPFVAAGADLADTTQRVYAANIWQETQTSLAVLAIFLPWLLYGLLFGGAAWGQRALLVIAAAGTIAATWMTLVSLDGYVALPRLITGVVGQLDGRTLSLAGGARIYLVTSDGELASARRWLTPGAAVTMWVSPRGQAGYIGPAKEPN